MRRAACVRYLFCVYFVLMVPIFPLELPWANLNCSQNTSFLFRPSTVINVKRHLSKGFEMATLPSGHAAVEIGLHPLTPLCHLTYEFSNLSFAPCFKDDGHVSCCSRISRVEYYCPWSETSTGREDLSSCAGKSAPEKPVRAEGRPVQPLPLCLRSGCFPSGLTEMSFLCLLY